MKSYNRGSGIAKVFFLLILIAALIIGGLIWLDFLGIIDAKDRLSPITSLFGIKPREEIEQPYSPLLLDSDRITKEREAINVERNKLDREKEELQIKEAEIKQKEGKLAEIESSLKEKEKSLIEAQHQYENKIANLKQTARYLMGMPPEDAVAIMDEYDIRDLVDLLRISEMVSKEDGTPSLVAYWLSLMKDRARAAEIQKLLVEQPRLSLDE